MNASFAIGAPRLLSPVRATAMFVAVALTTGQVHAQNLQPVARSAESVAANAGAASESDTSEVQLLVGRSTLVTIGANITRVSLTSPNVADAMVTTPNQLLIHGKTAGTISMFVWDKTGGIKRYEVVVRRDLSQLVEQMKQLFPGEPIEVHSNGKDVVISGTVSSKYVVDKASDVAAGYVDKKDDVVNLLRQQEGVATNQVMLRVRFAEVSRTAMTELGASLVADGFKNGRWFGRTTTEQFASPQWNQDGKLVFSDFLNLFLFDAKNNLTGVVKALQNKGLFQSLAEPNLIAENGKEASFLAGGEYPYPVVQGQSGGQTVTIQFKEFGVKLNFTPTIVGGDLVKLKVRAEVSSRDFANAVNLSGFRVPAISTRRTETEVELADGQTFAIAGLLNNTVTSQMSKIPGIGDIPILGLLFRSKAAQKDQTELVVMITPQIIRHGSTGVSPKLPDLIEPFMPQAKKTLPSPAPWNPAASGHAQAQPAPAAEPAARVQPPALAQAPSLVPIETWQTPVPMAQAPVAQGAVAEPAAVAPAPSPVARTAQSTARPAKPTKAEKEASARARKQYEESQKQAAKQAEIDKRKAVQQAKVDQEHAAEEQKKAVKTAKEQARLQAELDRRSAEASKRQAEIDKKKAEQVAEAQAKLDAARQAYEQEVAKIHAQNQPAPAPQK
jgi:pilus assembly protein CpaC